uniref:Uncharacterized protein n=1 Tax=Ixodes ricinus TaxID=34613 RepID=A0A6B0U0H4_IXORI
MCKSCILYGSNYKFLLYIILLIITVICCHNQLLFVVWLHTFAMMCKPSCGVFVEIYFFVLCLSHVCY